MRYKKPIVKEVPGEKALVTYVKNQLFKKNGCCHAVVFGKVGDGKSWGSIGLAYMLDPNFSIEKNVFFNGADFMTALSDPSWPSGTAFILDEAGIDLNNLNWQDDLNRGMNAFFQTSRHRNFIILLTVPCVEFVSKGVRTLMNMKFLANGFRDGKTIFAPRVVDYNPESGRTYGKRIIVVKDNGNAMYLNMVGIPRAPKEMLEAYEIKKKQFTTNLFGETAERMRAHEEKKKSKSSGKNLTEHQEKIVEMLKTKSPKRIAEELGVSRNSIYQTIRFIKGKGVGLTPVTNESKVVTHYQVRT